MSIHRIAECIDRIAPKELAQNWDNTGILIDSMTPESSPKQILLTIDFTESVLDECIRSGIKYVVSYHPVIFSGLKKIDSRLITQSIQNGISIYSPHTQLDNLMNEYWIKLIGPSPGNFDAILKRVKEITGLNHLRVVRSLKPIEDYKNDGDILAGVGATFRNVSVTNCLLITGEMSHHDMLKCKYTGVDVIMLEHSNSERVFLKELKSMIETEMKGYEIILSESDVDPVVIL